MCYSKFSNFLLIILLYLKYSESILTSIGSAKIIPENYNLLFIFTGENDCSKECIYSGQVNITMKVHGRADTFTIHADPKMNIYKERTRMYRIYPNQTEKQINIADYIITSGDVSTIIEIRMDEFFTVLSKSRYVLILYFSREFDDHRGFNHLEDNAVDSILFVTILIPNHAHRLFPCLTEVKYTSTFDLTIVHPTHYMLVAGTSLKSVSQMNAYSSISIFERTPHIQAHHLFFAIWAYRNFQAEFMTIWYPPNIDMKLLNPLIRYSLYSNRWMTNITDTYYSVDPMNIVPFPSSRVVDFYVAPGISLFRDTRILFDEEESTTTDRLEMLTDITRAAAQHVIGIMIFPKLWSDMWLYNGVADYVATFILDELEPSFRIQDISLARTLLWTRVERDMRPSSTLPYYFFDTWHDKMYFRKDDYHTYQTETILSMVHQYFDFRDIGTLVKQFLFRGTEKPFGPTPNTFVKHLGDNRVKKLVRDWYKNRGTPILHVNLDENEAFAELTQERYRLVESPEDKHYNWTILIRCKYANAINNSFYNIWMYSNNNNHLVNATEIQRCLLDSHTTAAYRINYPESWWSDIIHILKTNTREIGEMQRMRILDDVYELSIADYVHSDFLFSLINYLEFEEDYFPWLAGAKVLSQMRKMLGSNSRHKPYLDRVVQKLINRVFNRLTLTPKPMEPYFIRLHRKNIMNIACSYGHSRCLSETSTKLRCYLYVFSTNHCTLGTCPKIWKECMVDADIREIVFCQGLRHASPNVWYRVFQIMNSTNTFHSTKLVMARGLACTENINILENYISYMLDHEKIFPPESVFPILLTAARIREEHAQLILHFITKNHLKLIDRMQVWPDFRKPISSVAEDIYSENYDKIPPTSFGDTNNDDEVQFLLPEDIKKIITSNSRLASKFRPHIESYLENIAKDKNMNL